MVDPMTRRDLWAGVDVGGRRKGFHVAVISNTSLVDLDALPAPHEVVAWLAEHGPHLTAVDSPLVPAIEGERSRAGERALVAAGVCSLRYTPDRQALAANPMYYEWIAHGFELYQALSGAGLSAIECFPTASWTRWAGPRRKASRAAWSRAAVTTLRTRRYSAAPQPGQARCHSRSGNCPRPWQRRNGNLWRHCRTVADDRNGDIRTSPVSHPVVPRVSPSGAHRDPSRRRGSSRRGWGCRALQHRPSTCLGDLFAEERQDVFGLWVAPEHRFREEQFTVEVNVEDAACPGNDLDRIQHLLQLHYRLLEHTPTPTSLL
jgi:predicted nuclease with RNAse H fold